jgi:hypothetical protein
MYTRTHVHPQRKYIYQWIHTCVHIYSERERICGTRVSMPCHPSIPLQENILIQGARHVSCPIRVPVPGTWTRRPLEVWMLRRWSARGGRLSTRWIVFLEQGNLYFVCNHLSGLSHFNFCFKLEMVSRLCDGLLGLAFPSGRMIQLPFF